MESGYPAVSCFPTTNEKIIITTMMTNEELQLVSDEEGYSSEEDVSSRMKPPRPSAMPRKSVLRPSKAPNNGSNRRRSSARFLRLSSGGRPSVAHQNLNALYKKAIQMNAENKINASNSWNLNLIENIDKFLTADEDGPTSSRPSEVGGRSENSTVNNLQKSSSNRINFTKASCTLDASVKIYSYRVDDVHLTSYKVLANLNRSDANNKDRQSPKENEEMESNEEEKETRATVRKSNVATLETNLANINMNKLDSAFDIDPLFHKMSRIFDEGGAKGLLLANLGVGKQGCNIVFDSSLDDEAEKEKETKNLKVMNTSTLTSKLESMLQENTVASLTLVPQLASLREDYAVLEEEGFAVDAKSFTPATRRYAPEEEEEDEADRSIHQEAIERSRASIAISDTGEEQDNEYTGALIPDDENQQYAADDFGIDDDDDDIAFDNFIAADDTGARFSSISFSGSVVESNTEQNKQTGAVLDAIASTDAWNNSDFTYIDEKVLSKHNLWAGAAHWKRAGTKRNVVAKTSGTGDGSRRKRRKERVFVNFHDSVDAERLLSKPSKPGSLRFGKSQESKLTSKDNMLPLDAAIKIENLSSLFLLPDHSIVPVQATKSVGFVLDQENPPVSDWDDGDDDGAGYDFGGDDDDEFGIDELEGIRKVDKVEVGYATVAKKVDVKRLKQDLWTELEQKLGNNRVGENSEEEKEVDENDYAPGKPISFFETVCGMEKDKTQTDVSLPFYFICVLHLANEKGLRLDSKGLNDFDIIDDAVKSTNAF